MTKAWLTMIGIGEDGLDGLSAQSRDLIASARLVAGGHRHLALAAPAIRGETMPWPVPMMDGLTALMARRGEPVVVLASGDPYSYGVGSMLVGLVPPDERVCHPGVSAFALACARLAWARQDTATISFCGRPVAAVMPLLQPGARVLALSADARTPSFLAQRLSRYGFGASILHIMEALGGPQERMRTVHAETFDFDDIHPLNMVGIEVATGEVIPLTAGRPDTFYDHDGQLTRREVRAVTLSSLAPRQGELLWDVGGGAGSIGIEWMLSHTANMAIAVEADTARAARIHANADRMGVPGLRVVHASAPDAYTDLPSPDAVFLGGGAHRPGVIDDAWRALKPGGRVVANAVTIETEMALLDARTRHGGTLLRMSFERLDPVGTMNAYRPAMTVTQWSATKP